MISAIAIDDEPLALEILESFCEQVDFLKLEKAFTQTAEARKYLERYPVDLLFLDINMPAVSGIEFYKGLPQQTMVIFTTAHAQYAVEGFELSAVDYLLKPYSLERFTTAVTKARDYFNYLHQQPSVEKHIFVRSEYNLVKIALAEMGYVEGFADYLKIILDNGKTILSRMTMKAIASKLPAKEFVRVHRSFIVPLSKIESVRNKIILLKGGKEIPIGVSYEDDFMKVFGA
ncbi:two component transcriptional regulator, LytTR family [Chryseolinea serpens]|uniref:Two component transcriptional regulator, LytTR family n=1 Tax=Chryseolinea serpens TaxID=947013 RepID=A0A1M5JME3_9BACT|nr:LytTR family DNA-binding domain-containing protein [Chryseolinea serpens]SHG41691.1 two component transcriptional regulator, LytTR family [Chryseolinea serpens]